MPAVSTRLEILNSGDEPEVVDKRDLGWWEPRSLFPDSRFVEVFDNGYLDRIADLSRDEFEAINREQIFRAPGYRLATSADDIAALESIVLSSESENHVFRVTLFEWESGLD